MARRLALTGPAGAAVHRLDGFRDHSWPDLWCAPSTGAPGDRVVRTRDWADPQLIGGISVAPIPLVVRHLGVEPHLLASRHDRIDPPDRIELALEHALRLGHDPRPRQGSGGSGDHLLREVLGRRGTHRPTGSYAETRMVQLLRSHGLTAWRQVEVCSNGFVLYTCDFLIPFDQRRPEQRQAHPDDGLLVEVDSEEHHVERFERDKHRNSTYDRLAFHWMATSPRQIARSPRTVMRALAGVASLADPGGPIHTLASYGAAKARHNGGSV